MAVLQSKRKIAKAEFENAFMKLYQFSMHHTTAVPKRKKKWLCCNIDEMMNLICKDIMAINDCYNPDAIQKAKYIADLNEACIYRLIGLEKPLMVLWNVQSTETKHMAAWVELLNKEIVLLNLMRKSKVNVGNSTSFWNINNNGNRNNASNSNGICLGSQISQIMAWSYRIS